MGMDMAPAAPAEDSAKRRGERAENRAREGSGAGFHRSWSRDQARTKATDDNRNPAH
jgi:hypothetical protein